MNLLTFLKTNKDSSKLNEIILNIAMGSIQVHKALNEGQNNIMGSIGLTNIQNEDVQKLDLIANDIFINVFKKNRNIDSVLSEENENIIKLNAGGKYLIAMDPLDGSSNIDVNIPVGSIFSILANKKEGFFQKGKNQKLACYVIYGTTTMMVFNIKNTVFGFTLNTKLNQYELTHSNIKTPENGSIFSINEGNYNSLEKNIIQYLQSCKELSKEGKRTHTGRFVGSLIADFHRNMLKGGIFIYPKTADRPNGQLRLIYECNPIALIAKYTNGSATSLDKEILDIIPSKLHERTEFVVGSKKMLQKLLSFYK